MDGNTAAGTRGASAAQVGRAPRHAALASRLGALAARGQAAFTSQLALQLAIVFVAFLVAGKLGQATTNIRSGNLGPVWPASGVALAALLAFGPRVWPALAASSFVVAFQSPVYAVTAAGQAAGATLAAVAGAFLLRRRGDFDPALSKLRDALALIVLGALGSTLLSATIGMTALYATGLHSYSGLPSSLLIYWLGDATGVMIVTPLIFTAPALLQIRPRKRIVELAVLLVLLTATCFVVFGDLPLFPIRLHVLAFAVLPFVMWAAIDFGVGGASLAVFVIATAATLLTALGHGPFSAHTPFVNAALLDVLYVVLSVSGLVLAAVIVERERSEAQREQLIRARTAMEARLRLAAIVESSNDAILSTTMDGVILSWNVAAERIFGFTEAEAIGQPTAFLIPPSLWEEDRMTLARLRAGERIVPYETIRVNKARQPIHVSVTISPIRGADGRVVGAAKIVRDITEQKRAEEALSGVSRRLIEAQEQERGRIARELHDDIGQRLALLSINLTGLADDAGRVPELREQAADLQRLTSEIATDVQALSHQLHSSKLELLGITAAMRGLCAEFDDQPSVSFEAQDVPEQVPADVSLCLFRILQEALHNSLKHSGAGEIAVRLWGTPGEIHVSVADGGDGFDRDAVTDGRGIGLASMKERVKLVNGTLSIDTGAGRGTTVHARVPLHPARQ